MNNYIPIWIFHAEEPPSDSYYNKGNYCKYYKSKNNSLLRLNVVEKFIEDSHGLLLYLYFSKTNLLRQLQNDQYSLKTPILKFTNDTGPWLCYNLIVKVEDRTSLFRYTTTHINTLSDFEEIINLFYIQKKKQKFLNVLGQKSKMKIKELGRHAQLTQSEITPSWLPYFKSNYLKEDFLYSSIFKYNSSKKAYSFFYKSKRYFISINPTILFSPMIALITRKNYISNEDLPGIRFFQCLNERYYSNYNSQILILRSGTYPGIDYYIYSHKDFLEWKEIQAIILEPGNKLDNDEYIAKLKQNKKGLHKWIEY